MGVLTCPCKCLLSIINGVILLAGLLIAAAGGVLLAVSSNPGLADTLKNLIDEVIKNINIIKPGTENPVSDQFITLIQPAGIILLVVGLFIAGVSILGYCGLACYIVILKVYVVVLIVILIVEIAIAAILFSGAFNSQIQSQIQTVIDKEYGGIEDQSLYSVIPNVLMINFQCCGINDFGDFNNSVKWNRTKELVIQGSTETHTLVTPIACCKTNGTFPEVNLVDEKCAFEPRDENNNFHTGCWSGISDQLSSSRLAIILVTTAVMVVQLIFILIVIVIIALD